MVVLVTVVTFLSFETTILSPPLVVASWISGNSALGVAVGEATDGVIRMVGEARGLTVGVIWGVVGVGVALVSSLSWGVPESSKLAEIPKREVSFLAGTAFLARE